MYYGPSRQEDAELITGALSKTAEGFIFTPHDSTSWHFEGKDDVHSVGYRGIEQQGVIQSNKSTRSLYGCVKRSIQILVIRFSHNQAINNGMILL